MSAARARSATCCALSHEVPLDESLYSPDFASRVTEDLKTLLPFYRYFAALCAAAE